MTKFIVNVKDGFIVSLVKTEADVPNTVSESEYNRIFDKLVRQPSSVSGYVYKLRADNLEWELVELPPVPEDEPTIEDKAEAYDILMGEEGAP